MQILLTCEAEAHLLRQYEILSALQDGSWSSTDNSQEVIACSARHLS